MCKTSILGAKKIDSKNNTGCFVYLSFISVSLVPGCVSGTLMSFVGCVG